MSRQYTKISASKPPPRKKMVRKAPTMSALLTRTSGKSFRRMGT